MSQEENRKNPGNWINWAISHNACGDLKNAIAILKTACLNFPDNAHMVYNLACYYCKQDDFVSAKDYLKRAIELDNKYKDMSKNDIDLFPLFTCDA